MNIIVLDGRTLHPGDNPWTPVASLGELTVYDRSAPDEIVIRARTAQILLTNKTPLTAETLQQLPALRYIGVLATGTNIVDLQAAEQRGIPVCNVPEYSTDSVAELVIGFILNHARKIQTHTDAVRDGAWISSPDFAFWLTPQIELAGKTLGIVGAGRIGRRVAALAKAFRMKVIATTRRLNAPLPPEIDAWSTLDDLVAQSDFVSFHCPLTSENSGMINTALLSKAKHSAYWINTARGGLVNESDLAQALENGVIAGAALDVISTEPMPSSHPLRKCPNITITPHLAWATIEARSRLMQTTADNIAAFIRGTPQNVVNGAGNKL